MCVRRTDLDKTLKNGLINHEEKKALQPSYRSNAAGWNAFWGEGNVSPELIHQLKTVVHHIVHGCRQDLEFGTTETGQHFFSHPDTTSRMAMQEYFFIGLSNSL